MSHVGREKSVLCLGNTNTTSILIFFYSINGKIYFQVMSVLPKTLSREEEAELARSNKKVKDYHHADFNVGPWEEPGMHRDPGPNL